MKLVGCSRSAGRAVLFLPAARSTVQLTRLLQRRIRTNSPTFGPKPSSLKSHYSHKINTFDLLGEIYFVNHRDNTKVLMTP